MSPSGCGAVADLLPELALGIVGGTERADVLAHLDQCASCRDTTSDFAAAVDALPILLGEAEPPPGFETRTLARMAEARDRVPRRSRWARVLAVAALVAAVMIGSVAAVRILDARDSSGPAATMTFARMIGHSKHPAGHVVMRSGAERYLWLDVDYGTRTGAYKLEMVGENDRAWQVGTVKIAEGHGAWGGEIKGPPPTQVRLVGDDGRIWCTAQLAPT